MSCRELSIASALRDAASDSISSSLTLEVDAVCLWEREGEMGVPFLLKAHLLDRVHSFLILFLATQVLQGGGEGGGSHKKRKENIFYACMFLISGHVMVCPACW